MLMKCIRELRDGRKCIRAEPDDWMNVDNSIGPGHPRGTLVPFTLQT